jgi:hypothetical protein
VTIKITLSTRHALVLRKLAWATLNSERPVLSADEHDALRHAVARIERRIAIHRATAGDANGVA